MSVPTEVSNMMVACSRAATWLAEHGPWTTTPYRLDVDGRGIMVHVHAEDYARLVPGNASERRKFYPWADDNPVVVESYDGWFPKLHVDHDVDGVHVTAILPLPWVGPVPSAHEAVDDPTVMERYPHGPVAS
jgi:hypothetical protein